MDSIAQIYVAWALWQQRVPARTIAEQVGCHRATVYRWLRRIRADGIEEFVEQYRNAKKGRRVRKTHGWLERRVVALRREYRDCCGQKIAYLLAQDGIRLSVSTIYRILGRHLRLRKHSRTAKGFPVQRATRPRQVIQMDTLDLGGVYAFTAIDTYTREAQIVIRPTLQSADGEAALHQIMTYYGRCDVLQTDAGPEFKGDFAEAVTSYVQRHRIARPYRKNEQAFIECFNGTLRREPFHRAQYKASELTLAQLHADQYLDYYHGKRPHLALDMLTPAQFVEVSHLR